jgi:hypothetical protein
LDGNSPRFADSTNFLDFVEYSFNKKVGVSGDFWVGFEQHRNVQLNLGFDQNTDSREFFRIQTRGIWEKSVHKGTPMLRPVFGEITQNDPICCAAPPVTTVVKPNPANDRVEVANSEFRIINVEIYDVMGRKQKGEGRREKGEGRMSKK